MRDPLNLSIMDVNKFVRENHLLEVTSPFIHESSSTSMHDEGLFSERIFGEMASQTRLIKMGYIDLHCKVFHPVIFQNLQSIKRFYVEIMSGRSYAKWDIHEKDFVRASEDEEGAKTGYTFFIKHFSQIQFNKNASLKRNDKIDVIMKYKDRLFIDKCIVCPAGIRDLKDEDGRVEKDSINSLYIALLERCSAMPPHGNDDDIYDTIHYSIQRKVLEVYEYLLEFVRGKRGFFEAKLGARSVTNGTRNVITSASMESESPTNPQYLKVDEAKIPLFQAAKAFQSLVVYWIRSSFYQLIITEGSDQIPLINPTNYKLEYVQIDDKDRDALMTSEGIFKTIDRFRDPETRFNPVSASVKGMKYYLYLVYDEGNEIYVFRNLDEFKISYKEAKKKDIDIGKVRSLTYAEMIYIATYKSSLGKSGTITRYPVTDERSIYPAKVHLVSTTTGRIVKFCTSVEAQSFIELPEYPVIGCGFIDAVMFHPSRRQGMTADFDGDTISFIPILSDEANEECLRYYEDISYFVMPDGSPAIDGDDLVDITMHALTEKPIH